MLEFTAKQKYRLLPYCVACERRCCFDAPKGWVA